jgi:hypothetical protein
VLARVQPAGEPGVDRLALDRLDRLRAELAAATLGLLLERHQHLLGEPPCPALQRQRLRIEHHPAHLLRFASGGGGVGETRPRGLDLHLLRRLTCD